MQRCNIEMLIFQRSHAIYDSYLDCLVAKEVKRSKSVGLLSDMNPFRRGNIIYPHTVRNKHELYRILPSATVTPSQHKNILAFSTKCGTARHATHLG